MAHNHISLCFSALFALDLPPYNVHGVEYCHMVTIKNKVWLGFGTT